MSEELDFENYDGQGKSLQEETDASVRIAALVVLLSLIFGVILLVTGIAALYAWLG